MGFDFHAYNNFPYWTRLQKRQAEINKNTDNIVKASWLNFSNTRIWNLSGGGSIVLSKEGVHNERRTIGIRICSDKNYYGTGNVKLIISIDLWKKVWSLTYFKPRGK